MNQIHVKKTNRTISAASELPSALAADNIPFHSVACVNWAEFSYKPEVKFQIAHNGKNIFLHYEVEEADIQAVYDRDNGKIWEDSCVEFFISFNDDLYYNIECNCIGRLIVGTGVDRHNRVYVPAALLNRIDRWSSRGDLPLANQSGKWNVSLIIPIDVFHLTGIESLDQLHARGNFYKCGDKLKVPHFLSWNPIKNEKPNFHLSGFFGEIVFD